MININQVVEHTTNPREIVKEIKSICSVNTIVRVTVPNASNLNKSDFEKWPYGDNKMHILPFEHLHGFSGRSLDELFESEGLVIF